MKLLSVLTLVAMSCAAAAADREVRIFAKLPGGIVLDPHSNLPLPSSKDYVTGDTVPAGNIIVILFTREPCQLDLADKRNVFRAWQRTGAYQLGCWYPTLNGGYVFIGQVESLTRATDAPWRTYPRALLHDDGSATITEPDYNGVTFLEKYLREQMAHTFDHTHDKP